MKLVKLENYRIVIEPELLLLKPFELVYKADTTKDKVDFYDFMTVVYIGVLIFEIIKANIAVLTIMLSHKIEIEPCFCYFTTDLKDPIHRILLANSITLTPGTITVELSDKGLYKVHCLDKSFAPGMDDSIFVKMLRKMEEL